jgi:DNA-binding NtrC family response regulator
MDRDSDMTKRVAKEPGETSILVVDDDSLLLRMTEIVLQGLGYRVVLAASGQAAWERLEEANGAFDLVVLDQRLPDREGVSVMRDARASWPALRFLLVTGYATDEMLSEFRIRGASAVLEKPYDIDAFSDAVQRVLETDTMRAVD